MGKRRLALCASVLTVTALGPVARAADGGGLSVTPAAPAPGSDIALRVTGCDAREAVAQSPALVSDARLTRTGDGLAGDSRVRSTLTAGTYAVTYACDGTERKAALKVTSGPVPAGEPAPPADRAPQTPQIPQTHPSPVAPVDAGGGGTARAVVADRERHGPGTAQTVVALALAGTAAVTVHRRARRQARRGRGTG
ncbi:hypothetical protein ABZ368_12150 [Streptomyces sp. NPDC005908]|uniref:hypothetical protein n=1 Tax=unclassified Streptomyces TaxID=2593676 RepID=UPI0011A30B99|nr:hypothetical protein [Streptomyces sp. T12]TWD20359.1 hypothetical protein FB570_107160 [Streptomyces sp. T12]